MLVPFFRLQVHGGHVGHDRPVPVSEGGGVGCHPGHRSAQHPELDGAQHRRRGLEAVQDGPGVGGPDPVDEEVLAHGERVEVGLLPLEQLPVADRRHHVGQRFRQGAKAVGRPHAGLGVAGVGDQGHERGLSHQVRGEEGKRGRHHDVGDGGQLLRGDLGGSNEGRDNIGGGGQN